MMRINRNSAEDPGERPAYTPPVPAWRLLRGYAFDPSLAANLQTAMVGGITYKVRWEQDLAPGPSGECVEVVDYDPASGCFYAPIDLNHPSVLAQNGLAPSEGNPQFHQQMVYAVAMTTIERFERALGRKAFWVDHFRGKDAADEERFVQKLRIYPHALRMANAYYSRNKMALLFGYFPGSADASSDLFPGGVVFTCLSHDIVAHETTHALLDGFHEYFMEPTNPDALAFHEAFADIVALFQHFTFPEVLSHQIAKTRGDIGNSENLLGQLAAQFGRARGAHGALRDAIGKFVNGKWVRHEPDPSELEEATEVHARGAILVAAVFDAFLAIYTMRTRDLLRLASNGTGVLNPGEIHPDLVTRLAQEAATVAGQVLEMCIRGLEYCPPSDLRFGEFLRAIITADLDLTPDEGRDYRVAFIESFRRRGIYPKDLRTLSEDSLRWARPLLDPYRSPQAGENDPLRDFLLNCGLKQSIDDLRGLQNREEIWRKTRKAREKLHGAIRQGFRKVPALQTAAGLALSKDFDDKRIEPFVLNRSPDGSPAFAVSALREARRRRDDGTVLNQAFITLVQTAHLKGDKKGPRIRSGCTLVVYLDKLHHGDRESPVMYVIRKNLFHEDRIKRIASFLGEKRASLAATYFEASDEPFAALHGLGA